MDATGHAVWTDRAVSSIVTGATPSRLDPGLLDIILDGGFDEPFPDGAREIYDLWHAGRPSRRNLWARYDRSLRHEWAGAALFHRPHDQPDQPPGCTYHLDGRFVTDIEGFPGYDRPAYDLRSWGPATTLDDLLGMFAEVDVTVEPR
ncbi:hypothetical protein ACIG5D_00130 [Microbispora rosea]|uniref:hypothetical protein n=1 Tax=Microbispora rosea TaxID=58117 RepID=UPI0037C961D3